MVVKDSSKNTRGVKIVCKPNQPSGFTIYGGSENNQPIFVQRVLPNSPADLSGLRVGDELVRVNGKSFENIKYESAKRTIEKNSKLLLIVRLNDGTQDVAPALERKGAPLSQEVIESTYDFADTAYPPVTTPVENNYENQPAVGYNYAAHNNADNSNHYDHYENGESIHGSVYDRNDRSRTNTDRTSLYSSPNSISRTSLYEAPQNKNLIERPYKSQVDLNSTYKSQVDLNSTYKSQVDLNSTYKSQVDLNSTYKSSQGDHNNTYELQGALNNTYKLQGDSKNTYNSQVDLKNTYNSQVDLKNTYNSQVDLKNTYNSQGDLSSSTYEKPVDQDELRRRSMYQSVQTNLNQASVYKRTTTTILDDMNRSKSMSHIPKLSDMLDDLAVDHHPAEPRMLGDGGSDYAEQASLSKSMCSITGTYSSKSAPYAIDDRRTAQNNNQRTHSVNVLNQENTMTEQKPKEPKEKNNFFSMRKKKNSKQMIQTQKEKEDSRTLSLFRNKLSLSSKKKKRKLNIGEKEMREKLGVLDIAFQEVLTVVEYKAIKLHLEQYLEKRKTKELAEKVKTICGDNNKSFLIQEIREILRENDLEIYDGVIYPENSKVVDHPTSQQQQSGDMKYVRNKITVNGVKAPVGGKKQPNGGVVQNKSGELREDDLKMFDRYVLSNGRVKSREKVPNQRDTIFNLPKSSLMYTHTQPNQYDTYDDFNNSDYFKQRPLRDNHNTINREVTSQQQTNTNQDVQIKHWQNGINQQTDNKNWQNGVAQQQMDTQHQDVKIEQWQEPVASLETKNNSVSTRSLPRPVQLKITRPNKPNLVEINKRYREANHMDSYFHDDSQTAKEIARRERTVSIEDPKVENHFENNHVVKGENNIEVGHRNTRSEGKETIHQSPIRSATMQPTLNVATVEPKSKKRLAPTKPPVALKPSPEKVQMRNVAPKPRVERAVIKEIPLQHTQYNGQEVDDLYTKVDRSKRKQVVVAQEEQDHKFESSTSIIPTDNYECVRIYKNAPSLGISISGGNTNQQQRDIKIAALHPGGAANTKLKVGQMVISVDGESLLDISHAQAVDIIRHSFQSKDKPFLEFFVLNETSDC